MTVAHPQAVVFDAAISELIEESSLPGVLVLRLHRPNKRNALATPLLQAVARAIDRASTNPEVRCVVMTGSDTVFAAGADIDELAASTATDPIVGPRFEAWRVIRGFRKPLLAAVEGWCLGAGSELMMCCDIVVAGQGAQFGQPETNLGIIPGAGGTATLTRLVGRALAMRMVLTGEPIDAKRALAAGLIAEVAPKGHALERALLLAAKVATRSPLALREAKASVREADALAESAHLLSERRRFLSLMASPDKAEGIAAFREKRDPRWKTV
ncbi:enoyl-CoA hydratase-related protein [Brevundimonas sp.]|uniref:enoyl-CoA hydratase-related protein n=1 Tax=Brevundimonas sp. TaxID=1871086 RepID=UPI003AFFE12F